jgi:hypothetical protein
VLLALAGLALLARAAGRRRVARGPKAASAPAGRRLTVSSSGLGALLEWCARHGVDLVAVDVGLDTSTHDGRLVAGRLLAAVRKGGVNDARPNGTEAPTSGPSQPAPRQTGRTDRGPMAPQAPVGLIRRTR